MGKITTLSLTKLWINLLSSGAAVSAYSNDRSGAFTNIGEVKQMAGGRQRGISVVGEAGVYQFTLVDVPIADVDTLRLWKGQTVQVRQQPGPAVPRYLLLRAAQRGG